MIRIRKQGERRRVGRRDESAGNVPAVVAVPAPAAGAVSNKDRRKKRKSARGAAADVCGITSAVVCICHRGAEEAVLPLPESKCSPDQTNGVPQGDAALHEVAERSPRCRILSCRWRETKKKPQNNSNSKKLYWSPWANRRLNKTTQGGR